MAVRLRSEGLNCAHDVGVAGTAADVAGELMADVALGGILVLPEQLSDCHDHPRRTEAALQGVVLMESRLYRVQRAAAGRETFDRRDPGAVGHHSENRAGFDGLPVDIDGAGAALRCVATDMSSREAEIVTEQMNQKFSRFDRGGATCAVYLYGHDVLLFISIGHLILRRVMANHLTAAISIATNEDSARQAITLMIRVTKRQALYEVKKL
jgi:hypothetical protein